MAVWAVMALERRPAASGQSVWPEGWPPVGWARGVTPGPRFLLAAAESHRLADHPALVVAGPTTRTSTGAPQPADTFDGSWVTFHPGREELRAYSHALGRAPLFYAEHDGLLFLADDIRVVCQATGGFER